MGKMPCSRFALPVLLFFVLALFAAPAFAFISEGAQCPGLPEGSAERTNDCIMVGSTPCMASLIPEICAGTVNPDYPEWGPLVWISGTCYCPYTLANKCYGKYGSCPNGCDPKTGNCLSPPEPEKCQNGCGSGEAQNPYPDCACVKKVEEEKVCKNTCAANEARSAYPECACTPISKCRNVKCDDECKAQVRDYDLARTDGTCNPQTGLCEYSETKCPAGACFVAPIGKAACKEECDNGIDDDGNGKVDCEDPACKDSLYCSCPRVATNSKAGRSLKILVGGWDYPEPNAYYTSAVRDKETKDDAVRIANNLFATAPFSEFPVEAYATRLPTGTLGPWRSDLLAKCKDVGGDVTVFVRYTGAAPGQSRAYSMNVDMSKNLDPYSPNFERIAAHELGHAVGGLWDEYVISESYGTLIGTAAYLRDYGFSTRANCDAWTTLGSCPKYFGAFNLTSYACVQGCSAGLWYRSSQNSIMNDHTASGEFNEVSRKILRARIDAYLNPKPVTMEYQPPPVSAGYDPSNPQLER